MTSIKGRYFQRIMDERDQTETVQFYLNAISWRLDTIENITVSGSVSMHH